MTGWKTLGALAAALVLAALGLVPLAVGAAEKGKGKDHLAFWMHPGAHLGVTLEDVGPDDVSRLKLQAERGVIVKDVRPDTPAAKAGLKGGDVIVRFQGETVQSVAQMMRLVAETPAGRTVEIEVRRDGADARLQATLDERERSFAGGFGVPEPPVPPEPPRLPSTDWEELAGKARALGRMHGLMDYGPPRLGITFQEISGQLARYFKVPGEEGLLISSVEEGGPADEAGLRAGDVILKVGGREVRDADALREQVARAEAGEALAVTVQRDGSTLDLQVKLRGGARRRAEPSS
jgi:serine protease Do